MSRAPSAAPPPPPQDVTELLSAWSAGDDDALRRLLPLVYEDLRRLAHRQRRSERQALETTALVHEAYLRLVDAQGVPFANRRHFFAVAAQAMRHIIVDEARARGAQKRGGHVAHTSLSGIRQPLRDEELLHLDEALGRLARLDPRLARVVELRFFGGFTEAEAAEALGISVATLKRDWVTARAWLLRALDSGGAP